MRVDEFVKDITEQIQALKKGGVIVGKPTFVKFRLYCDSEGNVCDDARQEHTHTERILRTDVLGEISQTRGNSQSGIRQRIDFDVLI